MRIERTRCVTVQPPRTDMRRKRWATFRPFFFEQDVLVVADREAVDERSALRTSHEEEADDDERDDDDGEDGIGIPGSYGRR